MQHYVKGDKICLFGFSRGAYTARCLAGLLSKASSALNPPGLGAYRERCRCPCLWLGMD